MIAAFFIFAINVALHARGGNPPKRLIPIQVLEFAPARAAQLAGAHGGQGQEARATP